MATQSSQLATTDLISIETEPWTPPTDAHPEIALFDFVKSAWRILEPAVPFSDNWHIHEFTEHLEAVSLGQLPEQNLLVNTPPGTSKSLIFSVMWPAWEWTWAPWTRWLTSSYDDALAMRDAVRTRTLMQSDWYQHFVVEPWHFTSHQNTKGYYLNNRTGWRIATSMSGGNTGWHAHRVLVDDPHNFKKAESEAVRIATVDTWREVYPSRVLPGGYRVVVGQRVHEEDTTANWLERERAEIHHIEIKEEYEAPSETPLGELRAGYCTLKGLPHDPRTVEGELLTPDRFPRPVINLRKIELGDYAYSAQYQQSPTPRKGALLDPGMFRQTPTLERSTVDLVAAFDLNYSDADTSDWTIGLLAAVDRDPVLPMIHIFDRFADHLSEDKHAENIADWLLLWRPVMVGIEKRAYEREGATRDLCRQIMNMCEERGYGVHIEPIECDGDKITRAMIIPGRAKAGRITFDKRAPWWPTVSRQFSQFPRSSHDDDVDACAHLVRLVVEKLQKVRALSTLLGHHAALEITEGGQDAATDLQKAGMAGVR